MEKIDSKNLDSQFKYDIANFAGGENIKLCFACGTCTAGCPVSEIDKDFNPRKIIRQVLLGIRKEVLSSDIIWRCVQCYSCTAKCPQNVRFREIIKALRLMAVAEGYVDKKMAAEVENLGPFAQKLRENMLKTLFKDKTKFESLKKELKKIVEP